MSVTCVTPEVIKYILLAALRNPSFGEFCVRKLSPDYFTGENELVFRIIWDTIVNHYNTYNTLPSKELLITIIRSRFTYGGMDDHPLLKDIQQTINLLYDRTRITDAEVDINAAKDFCKLLISRYYKEYAIKEIAQLNGDATALGGVIEEIQNRYSTANSFGKYPTELYLPEDLSFLNDRSAKKQFYVPFIDTILEGGGINREVNVLLGPTGGGKSLLGLQLCTAPSVHAYNVNVPVEEFGLSVFVSYELALLDLQKRAISQAAKIPASDPPRIDEIIQGSPLSTQGAPLEYERELFPGIPDNEIACEEDRYNNTRDAFRKYMRLADFSGSKVNGTSFGSGGIDEVVDYLKAVTDDTGAPIRSVVLDWAGAAVQRELLAANQDPSRYMVMKLSNYVQEVSTKIASKFDCIVWVVHQLKGAVTARGANKLPHHSEAAWCTSFAQFAWFAFALGTQDRESGMMIFNCSKQRRTRYQMPRLLTIDKTLTFIDKTESFEYDPTLGFVSTEALTG